MGLLVDILSWIALAAGSFFTLAGGIGLVRMPDVFTRMHAASLIDTLGIGFLALGMMLQAGFGLVTLKLLILLAIFFFVSPVVTHAVAQAALHDGQRPILTEDRRARARAELTGEGRRPS